jgi:hypothetical protein
MIVRKPAINGGSQLLISSAASATPACGPRCRIVLADAVLLHQATHNCRLYQAPTASLSASTCQSARRCVSAVVPESRRAFAQLVRWQAVFAIDPLLVHAAVRKDDHNAAAAASRTRARDDLKTTAVIVRAASHTIATAMVPATARCATHPRRIGKALTA